MSALVNENCVRPKHGGPSLNEAEIAELMQQLPLWELLDQDNVKRLECTFEFKNFAQALVFTNRVGEMAEEQDHHPALLTEWGKVTVTWWTHAVGGLHRNDFIAAAKTTALYAIE